MTDEQEKVQQCDCVGVRCGAHPLGKCGGMPAKKYAFRLVAGGHILTNDAHRWYCDACAAGLKAIPFEKRFEANKTRLNEP